MAESKPELIAERYSNIPVRENFIYTFEQQDTFPVDGTNPFYRRLSPFTISFLPPDVFTPTGEGVDVNLLGKANRSTQEYQDLARQYKQSFGVGDVTGTANVSLTRIQSLLSQGQTIQQAVSDEQRSVLVTPYTAADIVFQVQAMLEAPPLTLLVNPNTFSVSYTPVQEYGEQTRTQKIFSRWGEEQVDISFSGSTGAFVTGLFPNDTNNISGFGWASRRNSAAYQNFVSLLHFFKNNGMIIDTINRTSTNHMAGALVIKYDQRTFIGHMEGFDYSFTAEKYGSIDWSVTFKADRIYDHYTSPTYLSIPNSSTISRGVSNPLDFTPPTGNTSSSVPPSYFTTNPRT